MFRTRSREGSRKTTRLGSTLVAAVMVAGMAQVIASPAGAAVTGGESIEVFTGANLVSLTSYPPNTSVLVEVLRRDFDGDLHVIGSVTKETDAEGSIELNHVGGDDCFTSRFSPDIVPGDVMRTTVGATNIDTSVVRGVWVDKVRFDTRNKRIIATGHVSLRGAKKVAPRADVLELRINKGNVWDVNDRPGRIDRRVDIGANVQRNGSWRKVLRASRADVREAKADSEIFLEWSGAGAGEDFPSELTVWDVGEGALPGCPPFLRVPSAPKLAAADDSNVKGDHITTRSRRLNFSGDTGQVGRNATVKLFVGGNLKKTVAARSGAYSFKRIALKPRKKPYKLMVRAQADSAPFDSVVRTVKIDRAKPFVGLRSISPARTLDLSSSRSLALNYRISEAATLKGKILNSAGRTVRRFDARKMRSAGLETYRWNGKNNLGRNVAPGGYKMLLQVTDLAGNRKTNRDARMTIVR